MPESAMDRLRFATLNLWGMRGDWTSRRAVLVDGFRRLAPDLATFQESIVADHHDQVVEILGPDYHVVHQANRESDGQGISIASRWPVLRTHEVDLAVTPRTAGFACTTLVAEFDAPHPVGSVLVANHFPSYLPHLEYERELQAVAAARYIESAIAGRDMHVILAGDLDADPEAASTRFLTGRQSLGGMSVCYRDAWASTHHGEPGGTFVPENPLRTDLDWPFRRIDYILVRCADGGQPTLTTRSCKLIFNQPVAGIWASDHFGLVADLTPAGGS